MESKRKTRRVRKAVSEIPEPRKPDQPLNKPSPEYLINRNGELVEQLISSEVWKEIVFPLIEEMIASVTGRYTNGRFYNGQFESADSQRLTWLAGYQTAIEEFHNHLADFIVVKQDLKKKKIAEESEKTAPVVNPFLEELDDNEEKIY